MDELLQRTWLDNSVKDYLVVLGVIVAVLVLNRLISRYLAGLLYRLFRKTWKELQRQTFINLIVRPLGNFLVLLVAVIALHTLTFPSQLEAEIYGYSAQQILRAVASMVLIISFTSVLLRVIDFIAFVLEEKANRTPDQSDNQLILFFKDFFKVLGVIIGIMLVLKFSFGLAIGNLLTGLSILGAAVALALRESLENLIASFIIFFDKPFTTGDTVKVVNVTGTVERIGLRSTRIRTDRKTYVTVPNKQMVDTVLDNVSLSSQRRADLRIETDLQTPSSKLENLVSEIRKILDRPNVEESLVHLLDITANAFVIQVEYYTAVLPFPEYNELRQDVNLKILKQMEALEIKIAGNRPAIRIVDPSK